MTKSNMTINQITNHFIEKYKIDDKGNPEKTKKNIYQQVYEVITKYLKLKGHRINNGKRKEYTPKQVREIEKYMKPYLRKRSSDEEIRHPFTPARIKKLKERNLERCINDFDMIQKQKQRDILNHYRELENELKLNAIFNIFYENFDRKQYYDDLQMVQHLNSLPPYDVSDDVHIAMERLKKPELYYFNRRTPLKGTSNKKSKG